MIEKRWYWEPVSQDGIKSSQIFFKTCPKSNHRSLYVKWNPFQNSSKYLGYFCIKICHQELLKIAQSGRTGRLRRDRRHKFGFDRLRRNQICSEPVWPDLAKFRRHFGQRLIISGKRLRVYLAFGDSLRQKNVFEQIFIVVKGKLLKNYLAIWSHWVKSALRSIMMDGEWRARDNDHATFRQ